MSEEQKNDKEGYGDVNNPDYWKKRLAEAAVRGQFHYAIMECGYDTWRAIERKHKKILLDNIMPNDSILDCGCGWGRLLSLLPKDWAGKYVGVDLSPDFIDLARKANVGKYNCFFHVGNLSSPQNWGRHVLKIGEQFDWAVLISIRPMIIRNLGKDAWDEMEKNIRRCAKRLMYLEYDEADDGEIE